MKVKDLYKVETLDSRFLPHGQAEQKPLPDAHPSKWNTPEYYVYYLFFLTIPPLMFKSVYDVSQPSHPNYARFEDLLSPGWIPGRKVDNSDAQYRGFRDNIPYMAIVLLLHPLLRKAYERLMAGSSTLHANSETKRKSSESSAADARLEARTRFDLTFALLFILALHGSSAFKILLLIYINFQIAITLPQKPARIATWTFNIGVLFANELCHGYPYASVFSFSLSSQPAQTGELAKFGAWLDGYGGLIPRWEVLFNFTVLRLIAYNFDYLWMLDRREASPVEKKSIDPSILSEKDRIKYGAISRDFTFRNYLAYILYSPLFLAGPIINFNDYISQCRYPPPTASWSRIIPYAARFILCLLIMELCQHYLYAVAISKSNPDWTTYSPFQLSMLGYFNLHIIWLKLLLPWRFFRLWALVDGIDPPENMVRCMSDNFSTLAFWRSWHRSFNQWITRYIYIPLGGSRVGKGKAVMNFLAVFTFVALWHDINLRLLIWGWLVVLFVLPEAIAMLVFPSKQWKNRPNTYRWMCGIGATGNILMMMAANLVGFAVGLDGLQGLVHGIVSTFGGRVFFLAACITLFVGVQVMFEVREAEKRRGINLKC